MGKKLDKIGQKTDMDGNGVRTTDLHKKFVLVRFGECLLPPAVFDNDLGLIRVQRRHALTKDFHLRLGQFGENKVLCFLQEQHHYFSA